MNEVEKMYENAGITGGRFYCCPNCDETLERFLTGTGSTEFRCSNPNCDYFFDSHDLDYADIFKSLSFKNIYPPFTSEKQLELIKWLAEKDYGNCAESLLISIRDGYNYLSVGITTDFGSECFYEDFTFDNKQFDEALAGLINKLWKKLTEEERKQITEILR